MSSLIEILIVACVLQLAHACSSVHVPSPIGTVIGRTMELGGTGGEASFRGLSVLASDRGLPWTIVVRRRGEVMGKGMSIVCGGRADQSWTTKFGYVGVELVGRVPRQPSINITGLASDGINEAGLTVSEHTLRQSQYMPPSESTAGTNVCFAAMTGWLLGTVDSVSALRKLLPSLHILGPAIALPSGDRLHWSIDDAHGEHVVLEVLEGQLYLHNNTVGTFTNDPDFRWHLRNLNNYANLMPSWPEGGANIQVQSEIGALPNAVAHTQGPRTPACPPARPRLHASRSSELLRARASMAPDVTSLSSRCAPGWPWLQPARTAR